MPSTRATTDGYDTLVMQGGGIRCLWQAGFLSAVAAHWDRMPAHIVAVSAGSAIACAFAASRLDAGVEAFRHAVSRNRKNFYPAHLFSRKRVFPHAAMYREVLAEVLTEAGMSALQRGPDLAILLCRLPQRLSKLEVTALLLGLGVAKQVSSRRMRATLVRTGGLHPEFVSVRSCGGPREVADLVIASSSTPPFTPLMSFQGRTALDGGLVESVPMSGLPANGGRALVLLTGRDDLVTHRASLPNRPGIVYVAPSRHVEGSPWDYANPSLVDAFYALGREDGARFVETDRQWGQV